ncbi:MAG: hypothetical protein ABW168_00070 [Sedimenticola sp.]
MSINFHTVNNFNDELYDFLSEVEAPHNDVRLVGGNLTIGIGFDLIEGGSVVRKAVYKALGIEVDLLASGAGTAAQRNAEQGYINSLDAAIQAGNIAQLHTIMAQRAADGTLNGFANQRHATFEFWDKSGNGNTEDEMIVALNGALPYYKNEVSDILFGAPLAWQTYQDPNGTPFSTSRECIALLSLAWNAGPGIVGPRLRSAILNNNRAEAWFEIRYQSNRVGNLVARGQQLNANDFQSYNRNFDMGWAKRRYYESQVFGLYDDAPQNADEEFLKVMRTFARTVTKMPIMMFGVDWGWKHLERISSW